MPVHETRIEAVDTTTSEHRQFRLDRIVHAQVDETIEASARL